MTEEQVLEINLEDLMQAASNTPSFRHAIYFENDIEPESVQGLIDILGNHSKVDLFFSTPGGAMVVMEMLLHYLNGRKDDIEIYLTDSIASAGTFILSDFEGKVHFTEGLDYILFHLGDRYLPSVRKSEVSFSELKKQMKAINDSLLKKYKSVGLTDKELKKIKSGGDVILYRKDFERLVLRYKEDEALHNNL